MLLLTAHVGSPYPLTKLVFSFPAHLLPTTFLPCDSRSCTTARWLHERWKGQGIQLSVSTDSHFRVINNGISLVVMILESFFLFISSVSEPRLGGIKKFAPPSHSSQGATTQQQNYLLLLETQDTVFFIYLCQKLSFLWEKVPILKTTVKS